MKKSTNNKTKLTAIIAIVLLMLSAFMITVTPLLAQDVPHGAAPPLAAWPTSPPTGETPSITVECTAYMSFRPNPVGEGQTILVNLWLEPPTHYNRYRSGYTVTITKPDQSVITVGPTNSYQGDTTTWFEMTVDQTGTWTLKFDAEGNYMPAAYYTRDGQYYETSVPGSTFLDSVYYEPCSTEEQELTVQEEQVLSWPPAALPTDYWTRPISIQNREWWEIGGQYPFTGMGGGPYWPADTNIYASNYKYTPYVQGPNTPHVVWKRQGALGGIVGGQYGYSSYGPGEGTYAGTPNIIFMGRCYQSITKVVDGEPTSVWQCYDLRTGEVYWERTGVSTPSYVVYNYLLPSVPGAGQTGRAQGGSAGLYHLVSIGNTLRKYDPWDGSLDVENPAMSGTLYTEPYVLSVQNLGGGEYRLINWTIYGDTDNFTERVLNNITFPFNRLGTCDFESMVSVTASSIVAPGMGTSSGTRVVGVSLIDGSVLWNKTTNDITFSTSTGVADHGKYVVRMLDGFWDCWDIKNGNFLWKSEMPPYPWGDFGAYSISSYGGMFFDQSYAGLYAFNWDNGKIVWSFNPGNPGYEAPFASFPWFVRGIHIIDGKFYIANGEHSPTEPLMRGWKLYCLNVTTGDQIWSVTAAGDCGAVSEGYLTLDNRYDGYMYVFGKGKSETAVSAPQIAVPRGTAMMITGTVLDMSPGQPGTPCVSADSMTTQMDYLHMQSPIDGIYHNETITGVPVKLTAVSSSGSSTNIGTTTTDGYHGTFGLRWTPTAEGDYKIIASFEGDDSYGSSSASTYVTVGPAPSQGQPQETEEPTTAPPTTEEPSTAPPTSEEPSTAPPTSEEPSGEAPFPTTEVIIVAAIAVVVVIGIGAYWALRRRK
jgi:hypothetical protein